MNITLTNTELQALEYDAVSPQELIENFAQNRARLAIEEIVKLTVDHCLDNNITVPATREEIVNLGFQLNVVTRAVDRPSNDDYI